MVRTGPEPVAWAGPQTRSSRSGWFTTRPGAGGKLGQHPVLHVGQPDRTASSKVTRRSAKFTVRSPSTQGSNGSGLSTGARRRSTA